jgi:NhaP-type Na+/H+ or K+/H+ antiporter
VDLRAIINAVPDILLSHPSLSIAGIVALGAASQWFAWRVGVPAILPLLVVGFVAGPLTGWLDPNAFIGDNLFPSCRLPWD